MNFSEIQLNLNRMNSPLSNETNIKDNENDTSRVDREREIKRGHSNKEDM